MPFKNQFAKLSLCVICALQAASAACRAEDTPSAVPPAATEFVLTPDTVKEHEAVRAEIEKLLQTVETKWNEHNIDAVMSYYSDDYINNDGLDKKAVSALTQDFWKTYPDSRSVSATKEIRVDGPYVTVESRDTATGTTSKEMPGIGTRGDLQSVSEGQLYLKKTGQTWKITGDRIDYEKVKLSFGLSRQLETNFSAPEQVKAGQQYSATLELQLPAGLTAVGSITNQLLQYPQAPPSDTWRPIEGNSLERIMPANTKNRNELLMATVGVTNAARSNLVGLSFLTRRLNVVPVMEETSETAGAVSTDMASHVPELPGRPADKEQGKQNP